MAKQKLEVVRSDKKLWKETIKLIKSGNYAEFEIAAEEANAIRVAASLLKSDGVGNFSVTFNGNIAIIKNDK